MTKAPYGYAHGQMNEFRAPGYEVHNKHDLNWGIQNLCRAIHRDNRKGIDAVVLITAEREGYGKSMLAQIIATMLASMLGIKFDWRRTTVFYDWYLFIKLYDIQGEEWDIIIIDEAWQMLFSRLGMKGAQIMVMQAFGTGRHKMHNVIVCGPNMLWFDKVARGHKAAYWLHITYVREDGGIPIAEVRIHKKCHTPPYPTPYTRWDCCGHPKYRQNLKHEFLDAYKMEKNIASADYLKVRSKSFKERMAKGRKPSLKLVMSLYGKMSSYKAAKELQNLGYKIHQTSIIRQWNRFKSSPKKSNAKEEESLEIITSSS